VFDKAHHLSRVYTTSKKNNRPFFIKYHRRQKKKKQQQQLSFFISFLETPTNKLCLEGVMQPHYYYFLFIKTQIFNENFLISFF
jgi:hypothetical protein